MKLEVFEFWHNQKIKEFIVEYSKVPVKTDGRECEVSPGVYQSEVSIDGIKMYVKHDDNFALVEFSKHDITAMSCAMKEIQEAKELQTMSQEELNDFYS